MGREGEGRVYLSWSLRKAKRGYLCVGRGTEPKGSREGEVPFPFRHKQTENIAFPHHLDVDGNYCCTGREVIVIIVTGDLRLSLLLYEVGGDVMFLLMFVW